MRWSMWVSRECHGQSTSEPRHQHILNAAEVSICPATSMPDGWFVLKSTTARCCAAPSAPAAARKTRCRRDTPCQCRLNRDPVVPGRFWSHTDIGTISDLPAMPSPVRRVFPSREMLPALQSACARLSDDDPGGRENRPPITRAASRSESSRHAAYTRSVVTPPPAWPRRPATVLRSTPAVSSSVPF